ncbi:MAG: hypothetical protein ACLSA1_06545 [Alphaproteobacteria bacterium]
MKFLKSVSRLLTIPVLGRERRKRARLEVEEALNALFRTEKYIYTRRLSRRRRLIVVAAAKFSCHFSGNQLLSADDA